MSFKHLITSTCMALVLSGSVTSTAQARHVTSDIAENVMDALILVQDIAAVVVKIEDLAELIKRNLSFGDLGAIANKFDFSKGMKDLTSQLNVSTPNLSSVLSSQGGDMQALGAGALSQNDAGASLGTDISSSLGNDVASSLGYEQGSLSPEDMSSLLGDSVGSVSGDAIDPATFEGQFEAAKEDAAQMSSLIASVLPPVSEDNPLTDKEENELYQMRQAIRNAAIADAYATAVAYQSKKTNASEEIVSPTQENAGSAETQQEKQAAANEVALAGLNELIENNLLTAETLKLQAAMAIGDLPRRF